MADLGAVTYTAVTWTAGDVITEAKMDNMVANDQAYDSHEAQGLLLNNEKAYCGKDSGGTARNLVKVTSGDVLEFGNDNLTTLLKMGDQAPTQNVHVFVYISAVQGITANTEATLALNTEIYDVGSDFNTTTHQFTAPTTGYYFINASARFLVTGDQDQLEFNLYHNSTKICVTEQSASGIGATTVALSTIAKLNASDTLEVKVNNTTNDDSIQNDDDFTYLKIDLLSL